MVLSIGQFRQGALDESSKTFRSSPRRRNPLLWCQIWTSLTDPEVSLGAQTEYSGTSVWVIADFTT